MHTNLQTCYEMHFYLCLVVSREVHFDHILLEAYMLQSFCGLVQ